MKVRKVCRKAIKKQEEREKQLTEIEKLKKAMFIYIADRKASAYS